MTSFNIYEAYAAVYDEELRDEILSVEEDLSFIDDLSDNELVEIMEEILSEEEVSLQECLDVFDAEILSEETEMERMNRLQNKATREKKSAAATAKREKSAERERVGRKHAVKRLQVAATRAGKNIADRAKAAGQRAKTLGGGAVSAVAGGARDAKTAVSGKYKSAKEKIKGLVKSGRKAVAGGLRKVASKIEPKGTESTGKKVIDAASRRKIALQKQKAAAAGQGSTNPQQGQPAGTFASKRSRAQAQKREARLTASENYEILADIIAENLIDDGYASDLIEAYQIIMEMDNHQVGEIAESYLVEETETVDLYDIVMGHLLDEGYADTEEAATVIMANMSEEWRQEILDEEPKGLPFGPVGKKFRKIPAGRQREAMMKREKDLTKAAMADRDNLYGGEATGTNRTKMGRISSTLTNPRLRP